SRPERATATEIEQVADRRNASTATLTLEPEPGQRSSDEISVPLPSPSSSSSDQLERVQNAVLHALTDANQRILVSMLAVGEWSVQGNELVVKVTESQTVVDMSLGSDARRVAIACASGVLGRAVKLRVISGAAATSEPKRNSAEPGVGGRGRAEQD